MQPPYLGFGWPFVCSHGFLVLLYLKMTGVSAVSLCGKHTVYDTYIGELTCGSIDCAP